MFFGCILKVIQIVIYLFVSVALISLVLYNVLEQYFLLNICIVHYLVLLNSVIF